jgi:hypothetical protein
MGCVSYHPLSLDRRSGGKIAPSVFVLTLVAKPGQDGIRALRGFLKLALRRFGLRCIDVQERTS